MNSSNNMGDTSSGGEVNSVGSISRSGRVCKKNSHFAVYESPDVVEKKKRKSDKIHKRGVKDGSDGEIRSHKKSHLFKGKKQNSYNTPSYLKHDYDNAGSPSSLYHSSESYSYDGEVPDIAAEEIIDESLLDEEDKNESLHAGNVRLKSQAQSTYMMEKSFEKNRKVTGHNLGTKVKATRKDKGSPRVTAYMLWAKEQRSNFAKKFPHMDFSSLSKKLSDLWATVPQNQKKMWKTKAAKIMRKNTNGAENMKNSGGSLYLGKKSLPSLPQRKGMKNTTPEEIQLPKRPPGRPSKKLSFLQSVEPRLMAVTPGPSTKSSIYNNYTNSNKSTARTKSSKKSKAVSKKFPSSSATAFLEEAKEPYQFQVTGTDPLDVAAHLALLGESMTKMGAQLMNRQDQSSSNESLSVLMDSLLSSVGPLLCLTQTVPELDCIPENQLKRILDNVDYSRPGL